MINKTILFVDDEPNILSGLKRMLRPMCKDMDFHFAEGGAQALDILAKENIQVIVSDMRMPGMDGAALLKNSAGKISAGYQDDALRTSR